MLLKRLEDDCRAWADSVNKVLLNECDMRTDLAIYLNKQTYYDAVYFEYTVPRSMLDGVDKAHEKPKIEEKNFPWQNAILLIDIVVEKDGKYAAVELKYATSIIDQAVELPKVFNEEVDVTKGKIIKDKCAQDIVMYGYWKDVRRIEVLTRFPDVVGGVSLMIANDRIYWEESDKVSDLIYSDFSMHTGNVVYGDLEWKQGCKTGKGHPSFKLEGVYYCHWGKTNIPAIACKGKEPFRYMMTVVSKEELGKLNVLLSLLTKMCGCGSAKCASAIKNNQVNNI